MPTTSTSCRPIGRVASTLTDPAHAPKQGSEGAPEASLVFEPGVVDGLQGLQPGDRLVVLTWLHRARRDVLRVHPRDDLANPVHVGDRRPSEPCRLLNLKMHCRPVRHARRCGHWS